MTDSIPTWFSQIQDSSLPAGQLLLLKEEFHHRAEQINRLEVQIATEEKSYRRRVAELGQRFLKGIKKVADDNAALLEAFYFDEGEFHSCRACSRRGPKNEPIDHRKDCITQAPNHHPGSRLLERLEELDWIEKYIQSHHNGYSAEARKAMPTLKEPENVKQALTELVEEGLEMAEDFAESLYKERLEAADRLKTAAQKMHDEIFPRTIFVGCDDCCNETCECIRGVQIARQLTDALDACAETEETVE